MDNREAARILPYLLNRCHSVAEEAAIRMGIFALQEREERSKGCIWCESDCPVYLKTTRYLKPMLAPLTKEEELRQELENMTGEYYMPIALKFCPECGRRLKGADNGT